MVVMSRAMACKGGSDAVGACGWSGPWGHMRLSVCNGQCPRPKRAVAGAASNDSNNIAEAVSLSKKAEIKNQKSLRFV